MLECHEEAQKAGSKLALEVFVAGRNRLENVGATALSEVFEILGSLVEVSMPQNGIAHEGICALAAAFAKNTSLKRIDLNDNTFTEEGSQAMADALPDLQNLTSINFGDCLVRPEGAKAIASAIKDSHKLLEVSCAENYYCGWEMSAFISQEVNLSFGELDSDAALSVADALGNKDQLLKLDLNGGIYI